MDHREPLFKALDLTVANCNGRLQLLLQLSLLHPMVPSTPRVPAKKRTHGRTVEDDKQYEVGNWVANFSLLEVGTRVADFSLLEVDNRCRLQFT